MFHAGLCNMMAYWWFLFCSRAHRANPVCIKKKVLVHIPLVTIKLGHYKTSTAQ